MKFATDLHLHSKYSRAVSQQMTLENIERWARYKGITVVATADFTHPFWFDRLKNELEETSAGLYKLKSQVNAAVSDSTKEVLFLLSCEISSIYTQSGKGRRIHNLFFFPKLSSVEKFNLQLIKKGANLRSDGRPIVGLSARDLAEIALNIDQKALVIPAHAWTPWFSVFGAFSGFDSLEECFGDMDKYIYAIETGLSSDPSMNWRIKELENRSLVSFSDAHSLEKMGREATVFEAEEVSYENIYKAIAGPVVLKAGPVSSGSPAPQSVSGSTEISSSQGTPLAATRSSENYPKIAFTIEFYPEEGKYHYTGHRDCNVSFSPDETAKKGEICPVCGKTLTIGVIHRVEELAQSPQETEAKFENDLRWVLPKGGAKPAYVSVVPLMEILAEAIGSASQTKKVQDVYFTLINNLGSEFNVLLKEDLDKIARLSGPRVAEGINRVRTANIIVEPGYDGKFGVVKIWPDIKNTAASQEDQQESQLTLFAQ